MSNALLSTSLAGPGECTPGLTWQHACRIGQQAAVIALGFCIPLSTTLSTGLTALYLALWVAAGDYRLVGKILRTNPVALASLLLFGLLTIGACYSIGTYADATRALGKYRELLYVPVFLSTFTDPQARVRSLWAFMAGVALMITLSYAEYWFKFDIGLPSPTDQVIFKDRIIHCILVAFFAYVLCHQAADDPRWRWLRVAVITAAVLNMFVLVQGRTGQVIVTLLLLLFLFQRLSVKGLAIGCVGAALFWASAFTVFKPVKERVLDSVSQFQDQFGAEKRRNKDGRFEFYELSLEIIREHPLLGVGTGGFPEAYRRVAQSRTVPATEDPHNEYLMLAVQLGVLGPVAFLAVLGTQWWFSYQLPLAEKQFAQGIVVVIAAGCLVNSLVYGFTGGLFWGYFSAMAFAPLAVENVRTVVSPIASAEPGLRRAA